MRTNRIRTVRTAIRLAAGVLLLAVGATPARASKCIEPLPVFPDAARKRQSVVFTNAVYQAVLAPDATLRVTLLHEGKPVGEPFNVYSTAFYGTKRTGGFTVREDPDYTLKADTPMPAAQPKTPVKFEVIATSKDRLFVEIEFKEKSIVVGARYRPWTGTHVSSVVMGNSIPGTIASSVVRESEAFTKLRSEAESIVISMQPESGAPMSLRFSEDAKRRDFPKFKEYDVRGRWNGYVIRGRSLAKDAPFYYYQYRGTMPADGFSMLYSRTKSATTTKVEIEFEAVERTPEPAGADKKAGAAKK